jgi:hypothetical protein
MHHTIITMCGGRKAQGMRMSRIATNDVTPLIYSNVGYVAAWWLYGPHLTLSVHSYSWLCESFNFQLEKFSLKVYWKFEYSLVRSYCNGVQRTQLRRQAGQRRRFEACNQVTPLRYQLTTKIQSWLCKLVLTLRYQLTLVPTYKVSKSLSKLLTFSDHEIEPALRIFSKHSYVFMYVALFMLRYYMSSRCTWASWYRFIRTVEFKIFYIMLVMHDASMLFMQLESLRSGSAAIRQVDRNIRFWSPQILLLEIK